MNFTINGIANAVKGAREQLQLGENVVVGANSIRPAPNH
jgi:hypothetical protein